MGTVGGGGVHALHWRGSVTPGNIAVWDSPGVLKDGGVGGLTVGSSAITGGISTQLLYDNAGVLGETTGLTYDAANQALTLTAPANPSASTLTLTGGTALTTSQPVLSMAQGWAAGLASPTAIKLNVTDGGATGTPLLLQLQKGASDQVSITASGQILAAQSVVSSASAPAFGFASGNRGLYSTGANNIAFGFNGTGVMAVSTTFGIISGSAFPIGWTNGDPITGTVDLPLWRDAPGILAQRNGANAQTLRVYNIFTDASNGEWLDIAWASNQINIEPRANGTGAIRGLFLKSAQSGGVPFTFQATNNNAYSGFNLYDDAGQLVTSLVQSNSGAGSFAGDTWFASRVNKDLWLGANTAEFIRLVSATGLIAIGGGKTSSFPALKRSSAKLLARLADDTDDAQVGMATANLKNYTVSGLPSASPAGQLAFVTDATTTSITGLGLAVVGGGTNKVLVFSDGTNWIVL